MSRSTSAKQWPHLVIRASAGTGKTFQLSNRYLQLLAAGEPGEQILATTFTRKAAGEILDRVLYRLAKGANDDAALAQLSKFIADGKLTRPQCLALLEEATQSLHRLRVGTLDSFFMAIAGSFCLELGLASGWTVTDEIADRLLRLRAIENTLAQDSTPDLLTLVHMLTKAETTRSISSVVQQAVDSIYAVFLETTMDAWYRLPRKSGLEASELNDVLQRLTDYPLDGNFAKARDKSVERAVAHNWEDFIADGMAAKILAGEYTFYKKPIPDEVVKLYQRLLTHAQAVLVNQIVSHTEGTYRLLEKFHREYELLKREAGVLRFDDVTRLVARSALLKTGSQVGFRLDGGVRHLLLDEFQDTSLAQWQVLRPFAKEVTGTGDTSFFCVGDVKQAIYGWRGGIAQIFEAIEGELTGLSNEQLVESFRSSQPVIDTVNRLFQGLTQHDNLESYEPVVQAWQSQFPKHTTARGDLPGYACVRVMPEVDEELDAEEENDRYVARYVQELLVASPGMQIGVLVRKNDTVRRIIFALRTLGIAASEEGGNPLVDSAAVGLILSLLRLADHPGDTVARFHLATSPLGKALDYTNHKDDLTAAKLSAQLRRELLQSGYGPAVLQWAKLLAPHCNQRELSRLDQLVELAYRYDPQGSLRADRFVALVEEQRVSDPSAAPVRVMNVHQAKGLQFDIVVLPELNVNLYGQTPAYVTGRASPISEVTTVCAYAGKSFWPLLPPEFQQMFAAANDQHVVEMLCMLYVAATRAVHAMHMLLTPKDGQSKKPPKSLAGLVRAALCENRELTPGQLEYETGDAKWYGQLKTPPTVRAELSAPELFRIELAGAGEPRQRGWQSVSPSRLEGGERVRLADVLQPKRGVNLDFGTLMHAWLAEIDWLENGVPNDEQLARAAFEVAGWQQSVAEEIKTFRHWLARPALQAVLSRATYQQQQFRPAAELVIENERRFALRHEGQLMTGSIDRLVLYRESGRVVAAEILDYKTDAIAQGDAKQLRSKVDYYRPQLAAYALAVRRMYNLADDAVRARLIFLSSGDCAECEV